uniref:Helicase ATP-binding domain-containing protein n=1 Tax=Lygus hesperus TaxID=30085 RepID=A0A0A9W5Y8_LYGHE
MADPSEHPLEACASPDVVEIGCSLDLEGCLVKFPFQPYNVQKEYMAKVISALNAGSVAALESPTGTGKTLSLLCSTLAWVEKNKMAARMDTGLGADRDDVPDWSGKFFKKTVFYASRTHSQLSKAMSELRRTDYKLMKATVLGSRDQMCVHPDLPVEESMTAKNVFCQSQLKAKTCRFYPRVEAMKSDRSFFLVRDIEDLVAKSKKHGCCPFYMSRHLQEEADIIFLPCNIRTLQENSENIWAVLHALFSHCLHKRIKFLLQSHQLLLHEH